MRLARLLLKEQSDGRLLELSAEGHEQAFEVLVRRHTPDLRRLASRIAPGTRADDVVQDAFMRAWLALRDGTEVANPRAWLMRITANAATDHHRRRYDFDELRESLESTDGDTAAVADRRGVVRDTLTAVAALPAAQREALLRIAIQGASRRDVAVELGVSEGAVRQLVHRARSTLRAGFTAITPLPFLAAALSPSTAKASVGSLIAGAVGGSGAATGGALATKAAVGLAVVGVAGTSVKLASDRPASAREPAAPVERAQAPAPVTVETAVSRGESPGARGPQEPGTPRGAGGTSEKEASEGKRERGGAGAREEDRRSSDGEGDERRDSTRPQESASPQPQPQPQRRPAPAAEKDRDDREEPDEPDAPEDPDEIEDPDEPDRGEPDFHTELPDLDEESWEERDASDDDLDLPDPDEPDPERER